jgi:hypothetical protein
MKDIKFAQSNGQDRHHEFRAVKAQIVERDQRQFNSVAKRPQLLDRPNFRFSL